MAAPLVCQTCTRALVSKQRLFCSLRCKQTRAPAVYRWVCPDGRSYVGAVGNSHRRGDYGIARSNTRMLAAFEQHPPESWTYEVLQQLPPGSSKRELHEAEQRHIDRLRSWEPEFGFNMVPAIWNGDGPAQRVGRQLLAARCFAIQQARTAAWRRAK
jgi:hypothetical protein